MTSHPNRSSKTPKVTTFKAGDGATVCYLTDRRAGTVLSSEFVRGRETVKVQLDTATLDDGTNERQGNARYTYAPNPREEVKTFSHRQVQGEDFYVLVGSSLNNGLTLIAGRHHYIDPNF